jgi:hypothetical protein
MKQEYYCGQCGINLKLGEAALDLLEACKQALSYIDSDEDSGARMLRRLLNEAIIKAEGR